MFYALNCAPSDKRSQVNGAGSGGSEGIEREKKREDLMKARERLGTISCDLGIERERERERKWA